MKEFLPIAAVVVDCIIGDPRSSCHPVVMIGKLIAVLEQKLLCPRAAQALQIMAGGLLVVLVLIIVYSILWYVVGFFATLPSAVAFWLEACLLAFVITPNSLAKAGREIGEYLSAGNLSEARYKVGWIVGRDTDKLNVAEITRATVETIAENIVDGIIAPLFYYFIGGVPLAFLYRAVNTMDSMIGYRNDKYLYFGRIAARVDDMFNYIPARLTGVLLVFASWILNYDAAGAAKTVLRDAHRHPSPNSGIPEAATAGALGIRLGGLNYYGGVASFRAYMGNGPGPLRPMHITRSINLMYASTLIFLGLCLVLQFIKQ
ncbi:Cobalamin biosynthesis protein CobD [Propionispora sp. 2/2-37]|uniref:adenosylcobinamide-phosphate synthase CbiB n=1 Tax=Propionispora sp. 2/2-37 TaxID=1677858 RepID=UPI0006BB8C08|nr:adenosylcobinamide-phosphate synthase CbiB [Propionispora sp. 2/2-37]CUH94016.1 Cobalamin biosynthesis protein CobD [Propionispora sp. 2/2-37]